MDKIRHQYLRLRTFKLCDHCRKLQRQRSRRWQKKLRIEKEYVADVGQKYHWQKEDLFCVLVVGKIYVCEKLVGQPKGDVFIVRGH